MSAKKYRSVLSENAEVILKKRYLEPGETVDGMFRRVSGGIDEYYQIMKDLDFLPNSPTLMNKGTGKKGTSSACFVFNCADSMLEGNSSIMATAAKAAAVAKWGGGVGYYFGDLRPQGALIQSVHRKACGPIGVLKFYNEIGKLITQGGRRELAQMGILPSWHDDIREFIHVKDENPQALRTFNISVSCDDKFMSESKIEGTKEHKLWLEICKSAWRTGDPGLFFYDTVNRANPSPQVGPILATNPCTTGETLVLTKTGWHPIEDLVGQEVEVWNGNEWSKVTPQITGKNQEILRITLSDGHYLDCTKYHKFILKDGSRVEAQKLLVGDKLERFENSSPIDRGAKSTQKEIDKAYLDGFYCGDGFLDVGRAQHTINFFGKEKIDIGKTLEKLGLVRLQGYIVSRDEQRGILLVNPGAKDYVPSNMPEDIRLAWLAGLLDSDGNICYNSKSKTTYAYQISSINKDFLRKVNLLLRTLGITGVVALMKKACTKTMPGGTYYCQDCYRLTISSSHVMQLLKFNPPIKRLKTAANKPQRSAITFRKIVAVEDKGVVPLVYCFNEPKRNKGVFNGVCTAQCGEQGLRSDESCLLGSINLANFVTNKWVDWGRLASVTRISVRFLNHILDTNIFPHPDITKAVLATRKIGLGVMGWADMLALMGIHYDTEDALSLGESVMKFINDIAREISIELGKEFGPYAASIDDPCRNEMRTTVAPTGTISILAGCSSSIEPHFALEWERTMGDGTKLQERVPVWDYLDGFKPKTSMEISWEWHVRHQAQFQKHVDNSISKTINLPNSATEEDISRAYRMMFDLGCKGGTIFRDGCRVGGEQVLKAKDDKKKVTIVVPEPAVKERTCRMRLPDDRKAHCHKFSFGGVEGYLHVGLFEDGTVGELFVRIAKEGSMVSGLLDAWAKQTSISLQQGTTISDLVRAYSGTRFEPCGMTKNKEIPIVSSPLDYIVRYLDLKFGSKKAKAESQYSGMQCPDCSSAAVYEGGCLSCSNKSCGWSRCG